MILSIYRIFSHLSAGKNQLYPLCFCEDWLSAFWPINQEQEFCQVWDCCRNISNISFHFRSFPSKTFSVFNKFFKKSKQNYFWANLGLFCSNLVKNEFSWKRGLCQFLNISIIYHHIKNQKKLMSHFWEKCWTDVWTDRQQWFCRTSPLPQHINDYTIRLICNYLGDHLPGNNSVSSHPQLPRMYF